MGRSRLLVMAGSDEGSGLKPTEKCHCFFFGFHTISEYYLRLIVKQHNSLMTQTATHEIKKKRGVFNCSFKTKYGGALYT